MNMGNKVNRTHKTFAQAMMWEVVVPFLEISNAIRRAGLHCSKNQKQRAIAWR